MQPGDIFIDLKDKSLAFCFNLFLEIEIFPLQDKLDPGEDPSTSLLDTYHLEDKADDEASTKSGHTIKKSSAKEEVKIEDVSSVNSIYIVYGLCESFCVVLVFDLFLISWTFPIQDFIRYIRRLGRCLRIEGWKVDSGFPASHPYG